LSFVCVKKLSGKFQEYPGGLLTIVFAAPGNPGAAKTSFARGIPPRPLLAFQLGLTAKLQRCDQQLAGPVPCLLDGLSFVWDFPLNEWLPIFLDDPVGQ
jgi:hypothetical protein